MINKGLKIQTTIILIMITLSINAQNINTIDSLKQVIKTAKDDTTKVNLYNELSWKIYIDNPAEAKKYGKIALTLAKKLNFEAGLSEGYNKMGIYEKSTGNYDEALECYRLSFELCEKLKDSLGMCMIYNNMGNVYKSKGDYATAIETLFKSLKINEQLKRDGGQADALLNIGLIYDDLKSIEMALDYLGQSLKVAKKMNDKPRISRALLNIANLYSEGDKDEKLKALDYYNQSLEIDIQIGYKRGQGMCLNNIGAVYFDLGQWQKAEEYYKKSLKIKNETGDRKGKAIISENLAYIEQEKGDYKKALHHFSVALAIIDSIGDAKLKVSVLESVAENYYLMSDYKSSAETYKTLYKINDSIFSSEMTEKLSEMQAKYETEKKDKEILVLQKNKEIQDEEIRRQKVVRNSIIGISSLILLLLIGSIIAYRDKKKANVKLALQKEEIEKQRDLLKVRNEEILQQQEEIIVQRDEIAVQRDTVTKQKEHIEEIHKEVTDSINYAKRIQEALSPTEKDLTGLINQLGLGGYFVLFKPKDIVSGDFYWTTLVNKWLIVVVADCTGHGVPGAFMSMLGISFLNEIVRKKGVIRANHVLNHLRKEVINALQQKGLLGEQKDGMDISLCAMNTETLECHWAGANNSLYLIRNVEARGKIDVETRRASSLPATHTPQLIEIKPDKMPIAIHPKMQEFTNHEIKVQKGDVLYLFTDGYPDQFGGPKGKKFKYRQFRELLIENSQKPMNEQNEILDKKIENWKNDFGEKYEQIDDITVLGLKI